MKYVSIFFMCVKKAVLPIASSMLRDTVCAGLITTVVWLAFPDVKVFNMFIGDVVLFTLSGVLLLIPLLGAIAIFTALISALREDGEVTVENAKYYLS